MKHFELLIIGGGAAGMCSAISAAENGYKSIALIERNDYLGGVLPQCIHNGFGLGYFNEDITGPEYAGRLMDKLAKHIPSPVSLFLSSMVLELNKDKTALISSKNGLITISFDKCILASGAREKPIGALDVAGTRPAGIFTAGQAQKLINIGHYSIGENIVILGSGDIGQIMARRLILTGKSVKAMIEINSTLGGLPRNQKNCIEAYNIPVMLNSTITNIHGDARIKGITVHHFDTDTDEYIPCDTLLTSVGLIPERELITAISKDGNLPDWLRCCGNCDYIHEIVDSVSFQAEKIVL